MSDQTPASPARDRIARIWASPGEALGEPLGRPGYALPDISGHEWRPLGEPGSDNWLVALPGDNTPLSGQYSGRGNVVVVGRNSTLEFGMGLQNTDATIIFGDNTGAQSGRINVFGNCTGGVVFVGAGTTCNAAAFFLLGDGARIVIGEDCMFAHGIMLRTNDDHAMIDIATGAQLNPTGDILLEPHIWVCPEVTILRGANIGFGSVIGTKAVVGRTAPSFSLVAGAPGKVAREGISWDRHQIAREGEHLRLAAFERRVRAG
jgi:acetyltransferase-like isoleucine patch superfamily enzyme